MLQTNIIINTQVEGIHHWPECNIKEVDFLKHPHRHIFYICCKKEVSHDDRDVEIIQLKRKIDQYILNCYSVVNSTTSGNPCNFGARSCEMLAKELLIEFDLNYCSVFEDNENGAEIFKKLY